MFGLLPHSWYCALGFHRWRTVGRERGDWLLNEPIGRDSPVDDYEAHVQECRDCGAERRLL